MPRCLESGAVSGITIVAWIPLHWAAKASPCAWLPAEAASTPAFLWASSGPSTAFIAPRSLYAPVRWRFSIFKWSLQTDRALNDDETLQGDRLTYWRIALCARLTSFKVIDVAAAICAPFESQGERSIPTRQNEIGYVYLL